jgi:molybdopterin synthase sulfur carrier subunit
MIKVFFFAELRERLQCAECFVTDFYGTTVKSLLEQLIVDHPEWEKIFSEKKILIAVNHAMANVNANIVAGDEVAFFPPVTGG